MLISGNINKNEAEFYSSNSTSAKKTYLNFFIERYEDAYKNQLDELFNLAKSNKKPRSVLYDGYKALQLAEFAIKSFKLKRLMKLR